MNILFTIHIAVSGGVREMYFTREIRMMYPSRELEGRRYYLKGSIDKMFSFYCVYKKVKLLTILTEETINENNLKFKHIFYYIVKEYAFKKGTSGKPISDGLKVLKTTNYVR